jgi:hypothetical protein
MGVKGAKDYFLALLENYQLAKLSRLTPNPDIISLCGQE